MAIFKIEKNKNFTTMSNYHFRDKTLSWKAKGILSTMLSLPDYWDYSLAGLTTLSTDGDTSTRSAIKELEEHGYLTRKPIRGNDGKITDWQYTIYERPFTENPSTEEPVVENTLVANTLVDNGTQLNTNIYNTKELSTNNNINILSSCEEIISYLNEKTGKNFNPKSKANQRLITARLKEGYKIDDFKAIVDNKVEKWKNDANMQQYLRPETLFCPKHFDSYLNEGTRNKNRTLSDEQFLLDNGFSLEYVSGLTKEEMARKRQKLQQI